MNNCANIYICGQMDGILSHTVYINYPIFYNIHNMINITQTKIIQCNIINASYYFIIG